MRILPLTLAILLSSLSATIVSAQPKPVPPSPAIKLTTQANNDFTFDLFRELAKEKAGENVFFSPWSISSALAMTMEGARGDTSGVMGKVLRLPKELEQGGDRPWRLDPYHEGFAEMMRRCTPARDAIKDKATRAKVADLRKDLDKLNAQVQKTGDDKAHAKALKVAAEINLLEQQLDPFELNIANAIWGDKTYPFDPKYVESVGRHYGTGLIREADFINDFPGERKKINDWVEDKTKDRIKDLIPAMDPEQARLIRMILVNAIYFKGSWVDSFNKKFTKEEPFLNADGSKGKANLMNGSFEARYAAFNADGTFFESPKLINFGDKAKTYPGDDGFMIAELPYKGGKLAMTLIAPRSPKGLDELEKKLTGETLTRWLARLESRSVQVKLPNFRMETEYGLAKTLQTMGMKQPFMERVADFGGMAKSSGEKLHISKVIHKAFVDVNEEGTEAAAATAVIMSVPTSVRPIPFVPEFKADRPFLFMIREVETGAVLFMGRMTTPTK